MNIIFLLILPYVYIKLGGNFFFHFVRFVWPYPIKKKLINIYINRILQEDIEEIFFLNYIKKEFENSEGP